MTEAVIAAGPDFRHITDDQAHEIWIAENKSDPVYAEMHRLYLGYLSLMYQEAEAAKGMPKVFQSVGPSCGVERVMAQEAHEAIEVISKEGAFNSIGTLGRTADRVREMIFGKK